MQKLDLTKRTYTFDDVKELVAKLEAKKIITQKEAKAININKVYQFTKSKIWSEMIQAKEVEREKPVYINIPAKEIYDEELEENVLVQGIIDLYYINDEGKLILVDFKTDYVENRDESILIDKYKVQLDLYKKALIQALGRNVDKVYIYSTYLDKEIEVRCENETIYWFYVYFMIIYYYIFEKKIYEIKDEVKNIRPDRILEEY